MFAQFVVTVLFICLIAEVLCRILLGFSLWKAWTGSGDTEELTEEEAHWLALLEQRQEKLAIAEESLQFAKKTTTLTSNLTQKNEELQAAETELKEAEERLEETYLSDDQIQHHGTLRQTPKECAFLSVQLNQ